jgi:hypothetical protein
MSRVPTAKAFEKFLVDQTPRFDEEIMQDIRPTDGWITLVEMDLRLKEMAWNVRELVWRICEGEHFTPSEPFNPSTFS